MHHQKIGSDNVHLSSGGSASRDCDGEGESGGLARRGCNGARSNGCISQGGSDRATWIAMHGPSLICSASRKPGLSLCEDWQCRRGRNETICINAQEWPHAGEDIAQQMGIRVTQGARACVWPTGHMKVINAADTQRARHAHPGNSGALLPRYSPLGARGSFASVFVTVTVIGIDAPGSSGGKLVVDDIVVGACNCINMFIGLKNGRGLLHLPQHGHHACQTVFAV